MLACAPERAFALFTERAGAWWPPDLRHTADAQSEIRFEAGGRFFERARDGSEVELGVVRAFEPGRRLDVEWFPGTGPAAPTRVEVRFEAADGGTRVTVRHVPGRAGEGEFVAKAPVYARSWSAVLDAFSDFGVLDLT